MEMDIFFLWSLLLSFFHWLRWIFVVFYHILSWIKSTVRGKKKKEAEDALAAPSCSNVLRPVNILPF